MKRLIILITLLCSISGFAQVCRPGQYDMLQWMAPQISTHNSIAYVVTPKEGTFYWVKSSHGFPWDVDRFDTSYIYQDITEINWTDPYSYKRFATKLPWLQRCVTSTASIPPSPLILSTIKVAGGNTSFNFYSPVVINGKTQCASTPYKTASLGYVINDLWDTGLRSIGTLSQAHTLTLSYRYNCDSAYSVCNDKEDFDLQQGVGLVQWTHSVWNNGWQLANQTLQGANTPGTYTPVHPCFQ